jgi:hypothetical protein
MASMSGKVRNWTGEQLLLALEILKNESVPGSRIRTEAWHHFWQLADELTQEIACFTTLTEMLSQHSLHGYRPTIHPERGVEYRALADAYDFGARHLNLDVVAYRGRG